MLRLATCSSEQPVCPAPRAPARQTFSLSNSSFYDRSTMVQSRALKIEKALQVATTVFLFLYVIVQPSSIAATHICYATAAVMWLARLLIVRSRGLQRGPLDLPILIYLMFCAISAAQSPLPASSWEGMRKVALVGVVLVFAQNVPTLARAKQLVTVLVLASLVTVAWSLWMYFAGVGLHVVKVGSRLALVQRQRARRRRHLECGRPPAHHLAAIPCVSALQTASGTAAARRRSRRRHRSLSERAPGDRCARSVACRGQSRSARPHRRESASRSRIRFLQPLRHLLDGAGAAGVADVWLLARHAPAFLARRV